jgi:hypothetical protein
MEFDANIQKVMMGINALSCMVDSDCGLASLGGNCRSDCGTAVNTRSLMELQLFVKQFSSAYCTSCVTGGGGCAPQSVSCVNGQCTSVIPLIGR